MSFIVHANALKEPESHHNGDQVSGATRHLSVVPEPGHKRTGHPLDGGKLGPVPNGKPRRVNRDHETNREVVFAAVPKGSARAAHGDQVRAKLAIHAEYNRCYSNRRETISAVLDVLINCLDFQSMTTRPGWKLIAETAKIHRATVGRSLDTLKGWGFLGVVASGRTAAHAAADSEGVFMNEAAVYVLCVPSLMAVVAPDSATLVGDQIATPPAVCGRSPFEIKTTHTRTREKSIKNETAPPPLTSHISGVASSAPAAQVPWRPESRWPGNRTTSSKNERTRAAAEIHYRLFPLRCMKPVDIAFVCKDFFKDGYTVTDIIHALDAMPDGTKWPHSGAPATKNAGRMRGWMTSRLTGWRLPTGEIVRSKRQREAAEQEALKRQREADLRRAKERQEQHAARMHQGYSPAKLAAIAAIHALREAPGAQHDR